jgi:hypothetical protein
MKILSEISSGSGYFLRIQIRESVIQNNGSRF